jgi:two-component system nitrogen regulation response regulator GlnG
MKANVRVIAATHQNLEARVKDGLFREDLYHRLNVIRLRLPSLRERREDIPLLTKFFLNQSAKQLGVEVKRISEPALNFLSGLEFPGNVRQLENLCNWITVMAPGQTVEIFDLPQDLTQSSEIVDADLALHGSSAQALTSQNREVVAANSLVDVAPVAPNNLYQQSSGNWMSLLEAEASLMLVQGETEVIDKLGRSFESIVIKAALKHTHGRKNEAAIRLGIGRNTITRKIQELGIDGVKDD